MATWRRTTIDKMAIYFATSKPEFQTSLGKCFTFDRF